MSLNKKEAEKKKKFNKILNGIKKVKIQGARNIAKAALHAYFLFPSAKSKKTLLKSRPTEPMMEKVLRLASNQNQKHSEKEILRHFEEAQGKINQLVFGLIKNKNIIFTHCHSTNVVNALIYAKKQGKRFEVYNTETRPLYQGRITASELRKAGIKVTMFIDSAIELALNKTDVIFLGADALLKKGVINKIGSGLIAKAAFSEKIPVYIIADSWKYTKEKVPIEQRGLNEVWDKAPKNIKIRNPAFEFVDKKYIKAIISELGTLSYGEFLKKVRNNKT